MPKIVLRVSRVVALIVAALVATSPGSARERVSFDANWKFSLGHATDRNRDFGFGTSPFVFGKAGRVDGPASALFDDRAWQTVNLPHDWVAALPFSSKGSGNRGSKAVGYNFPENSVGWYRKTFTVAASDKGQRIRLQFDGVYRDSRVWVNGFYVGGESGGYDGFSRDITDYLIYGGANVIVVRADATNEEGWYYEGGGIYRHVWLEKMTPVHVAQWGSFVSTKVAGKAAEVTARITVDNESATPDKISLVETITDGQGHVVARQTTAPVSIAAKATQDIASTLSVRDPRLWSPDAPNLYVHKVEVVVGKRIVDTYETPFGIRTLRFDGSQGFFLNGKPLKLKGLNNHQDHAGIGMALPDSIQIYRLERMKAMGANAYRTSHHPPTPEMLDAADRLGILVIDETRQLGTYPESLDKLRNLVLRDRNHPSVVLWSVGNEEWKLEWDDRGTVIGREVQDFVHRLDPSRRTAIAVAGSSKEGKGLSRSADVMGFNYKSQHDVDGYHATFPNTPLVMTEEGSTFATRGVYFDDRANGAIKAYDLPQSPTQGSSIQDGWRFVMERPYLAGMFVWTGFDYRGETTPFGWPNISSQYGMMDTTGRFKDTGFYLKSQWDSRPMVHLLPHWNWQGRESQPIDVWVYANTREVELYLNKVSLGRRLVPAYGHVEWKVPYQPGTLEVVGYNGNAAAARDAVATTGMAEAIRLVAEPRSPLDTVGDVSVINVSGTDAGGRDVPTADNDISFTVTGPGKIIGVGNGDPRSHEPDQFVDQVSTSLVRGWQIKVGAWNTLALDGVDEWKSPYGWPPLFETIQSGSVLLRGHFDLAPVSPGSSYAVYLPSFDPEQRMFVNGHDVSTLMKTASKGASASISANLLHAGENDVAVQFHVSPSAMQILRNWREADGFGMASAASVTSAGDWHRRLFNGHSQILVQRTGAGVINLEAKAQGLRPSMIELAKP
jgi:beta-galactosidase